MPKMNTPNLADAIQRVARPATTAEEVLANEAAPKPDEPVLTPKPTRRSRQRRDYRAERAAQRGIVVYVEPEQHNRLRRKAFDQGVTLAALCSKAILRVLNE